MEQKDYLLREIEKIGLLLRMIISKITLNNDSYALTIENRFEEVKGLLQNEMGFDVGVFLALKKSEIEHYIFEIKGINVSNLELLADVLKEMGIKTDSKTTDDYLEKTLILYELCNSLDKTFSFDRESKISELKNAIKIRVSNK